MTSLLFTSMRRFGMKSLHGHEFVQTFLITITMAQRSPCVLRGHVDHLVHAISKRSIASGGYITPPWAVSEFAEDYLPLEGSLLPTLGQHWNNPRFLAD
jgi:hypothetical protein